MPLKYEYTLFSCTEIKNTEIAKNHPCNAALMVGVFCTSN